MTTPALPPLLQPWAQWLSLFPDDLAATLGQLLLRLQPLVGPMRRHAARIAVDPAGVGDIVRRGSYDRLLISEWAVADSAPDEFLRRAANNEHLFMGPEPANSETSLRSVALFDAGPAQLGEPRLAHVALFILLARRAELAGAEFCWGILQEPGILHDEQGADGVRRLLRARTRGVLDSAGLEAWQTALGNAAFDCWLVGDPASPCPAQAHSRVLVRRSWFEQALEVELATPRGNRSVVLPMPAPAESVRLLRRPFDRPVAGAGLNARQAHSLKRAPVFGNMKEWLALGMVDSSTTLYRMPESPGASAGRPRELKRPSHPDAIVAAGLIQKSFGTVATIEGALHFAGFPGPVFSKVTLPLPDPAQFQAVPGALRWAPAFYWTDFTGLVPTEEVLVLDKAGRLVRWSCRGTSGQAVGHSDFTVVANDVIGAFQQGRRILFAVVKEGRTDVYSVTAGKAGLEHLYPIMHKGEQILFGEPKDWRGGRGRYALRLSAEEWLVGDAMGAESVTIPTGAVALGCARSERASKPSLVVLDTNRMRIVLMTADAKVVLVESSEPIAQASFDPAWARLAWVGQKSGALSVRGIDADAPVLRVAPARGAHAG